MTAPAPELSPEECYARAVDHLGAGRIDRAIKLLQVASLKAPHDGRYREALREAKAMLADQAHQIDPEALYQQAQGILAEGGDSSQAVKLLKIARARAPGEARYREALEQLQKARQPQKTALEEQGARLSQEAADDVSDADNPDLPHPRAAAPNTSRRSVLLALLLILCFSVGTAGVSLWRYAAQSIPPEPYQTLLPAVVRARAVGEPLRNELILTITEDAWQKMPPDARDLAARGVLRRAQQDDFVIVYLYSTEQRLLATAHPERIYFPE